MEVEAIASIEFVDLDALMVDWLVEILQKFERDACGEVRAEIFEGKRKRRDWRNVGF
jgi:hypothetical protein